MLPPAVTGLGLAVLVILRSASVAVATPVVTVAVLLAVLVSWEVVATVTVSVMSVPPVTFMTTGNVLVVPGATLGSEQLMEPVVVQVQPAGTGVSETNVVLAGKASVKLAVEQLLGPVLVTTCV
jgi:hypothetical protein